MDQETPQGRHKALPLADVPQVPGEPTVTFTGLEPKSLPRACRGAPYLWPAMGHGQCPIPISDYPAITMAHGGGGRLTQILIERMFVPAFSNPMLEMLHDGAVLDLVPRSPNMQGQAQGTAPTDGQAQGTAPTDGQAQGTAPTDGQAQGTAPTTSLRLAFSTDSFVVSPRFFPGGDIGSLAVHGTINDLAMCGARPLALSAGLILEEGLPMEELWRIICSMSQAAEAAGVPVVTGDTKVVDRGKGDGIFINTTGIGLIPPGVHIAPSHACPDDVVLINGPIAVHGIAIMSVREGLAFETALQSDSAPLHGLVARILDVAGEQVHVLRDPTRGGVASALNEIAAQAGVGIRLDEARIPIGDEVRGACEILGLDPLYVANEGKCLVIVPRKAAEAVLDAMRGHPLGREAAIIGEVVADHPRRVVLRSRIGGLRILDMLSGEQLPRIC